MLKALPRYDNKWMKTDLQVRLLIFNSHRLHNTVYRKPDILEGSCFVEKINLPVLFLSMWYQTSLKFYIYSVQLSSPIISWP